VNDDDYHRETETRQQIIRIFLIISSFFVAFSEGEVRKALGIIFEQFLVFAILYYIFLTRSKNTFFILFGILSSYVYSLLFIIFFSTQLGDTFPPSNLLAIFLLLITLVTFALLAPSTSERYVRRATATVQGLTQTQRKILKWAIRAFVLIFLIFTFVIGDDTITL
jgi:hypothetical protein